jgi:hypothetical protein
LDTQTNTQTRRKLPKQVTPEVVETVIKLSNGELTQQEMGDITGLERSTISRILSRYKLQNDDIKDYTEHRITLIRGVQDKLLNAITDDDIKKMQPTQKFMGYGILVDKEQAILGNNGSNKPQISVNISFNGKSVQSVDAVSDGSKTIDIT